MSSKIFFLVLFFFGTNCAEIPADYCQGLNGVMLPHPDPTRCTEFVLCLLETPFVLSCMRPNEIFHPPAQDCQPGNPETCELLIPTTTPPVTTTTEPTTTTTEIPTTTTTEQITTTTEPITITTELITTTTEGPTTTEITTTTTTESVTTTTTTESIPTTTTTEPGPEITTTTTQRPIGPPELCIGNNFRNVADPEYCYRFYYCMLGLALPGICDPDRIFSERWRGCVFGDWETCIPRSPIVPFSVTKIRIHKNM